MAGDLSGRVRQATDELIQAAYQASEHLAARTREDDERADAYYGKR